jgi:hypothetical protein
LGAEKSEVVTVPLTPSLADELRLLLI